MAVLPVKKMTIFALEEDNKQLLSALQKYGGVQINDLSTIDDLPIGIISPTVEDDRELSEYNTTLDKLSNAIKFLSTYDEAKKPLLAPRPNLTHIEVDEI